MDKEDVYKLTALILDAHYGAIKHPKKKTFNQILRDSCLKNFGMDIDFPNHKHSKKILKHLNADPSDSDSAPEEEIQEIDDPAKINRPGEPTYQQVDEVLQIVMSPKQNNLEPRSRSISNSSSKSSDRDRSSSSRRSSTSSRSYSSPPESPRSHLQPNSDQEEDTLTETPRNSKRPLSVSPEATTNATTTKRRH